MADPREALREALANVKILTKSLSESVDEAWAALSPPDRPLSNWDRLNAVERAGEPERPEDEKRWTLVRRRPKGEWQMGVARRTDEEWNSAGWDVVHVVPLASRPSTAQDEPERSWRAIRGVEAVLTEYGVAITYPLSDAVRELAERPPAQEGLTAASKWEGSDAEGSWWVEVESDCFKQGEPFVVSLHIESEEGDETGEALSTPSAAQARDMAAALLRVADQVDAENARRLAGLGDPDG